MGEGTKKKRAAEARAARKRKLEMANAMQLGEAPLAAGASTDPTSSDVPTRLGSNARNSKKTGTAPHVMSQAASVPSRQSTRSGSLGSSSRLGSGKKNTSVNLEGTDNGRTRPQRSATAAAMTLLQELQFSETEEAEHDPEGVLELEDEDEDVGTDGDLGSDDASEIEVIEEPVARKSLAKPTKVRKQAIDEGESSSESSSDEFGERFSELYSYHDAESNGMLTDVFDMTFEVNDKARGARKNITLPSFTSWDTLKDKVAQVLNRHPGLLQLQYRFSNEKSNSLPFDLLSLEDYHGMCDQLRPLVVPKILASGKPSKSARKLVMVQLFDKGMEGVPAGGEKGVKVSRYITVASILLIYIYCQFVTEVL